MDLKITEADFVNLANRNVGSGLLNTGKTNYNLAQELSKIVAIAFAKFINGHRLDFQTATPDGYWIGLDMKRYSTEELYDLFTQSKEYKELMDGK